MPDSNVFPIIKLSGATKHNKQETSVQKINNFFGNLNIRVFDHVKEFTVLSVYLDDDGALCIDVESQIHPLQQAH
jgi:hypothetical protein